MSIKRGSLNSVPQELIVSSDNIKRWKKEFSQVKLTGKTTPVRTKEQVELIRLRKKLADVKMERDILKKAVGIFSMSDKSNINFQSRRCVVFKVSKYTATKQLFSKLMKSAYLQSIIKRKFKITTNSSHRYLVVENILNRKFTV